MYAIISQHLRKSPLWVVFFLLFLGCRVTVESETMGGISSPLHVAILHQEPLDKIKDIAEQYPELLDRDEPGFGTPLYLAAVDSREDVVALLLDRGVDINERMNDTTSGLKGLTLLSYAARFNDFEMARLALDRGVDVSLRCDPGGTALEIAREQQNNDIVKLIEQHSESGTP